MEFLMPIETHLRKLGMQVTRDWLQECIEYFCEQSNNSRMNLDELCSQVKQQWLLGDLRDISPGCLPANLNSQVRVSLNGIYALQLDYIIDIGTPAYQQLQKLEKVDTTNIEVTNNSSSDPPPQRIFKIYFTDGLQDVCGIEYKPMRNLTSSLTPGIKVQIKGPIDCRRGVLMLEEKHIIILGGEVDSLLETNNYKNILNKKINRSNNTEICLNAFTRDTVKPELNLNPSLQTNSNINSNIKTKMNTPNEMKSVKEEELNINMGMFEDDMFDNQIISQVEAIESRIKDERTNFPSCSNTSRKNPFTTVVSRANAMKEVGMMCFNDYTEKFSQENFQNELIDDDIFMQANEIFENSKLHETPKIEYPIEVDKNPFIYINQLLKISENLKTSKVFIIKAQILKVVGKLSFPNEKWNLKCSIVDGSGSLDVNIESRVLSEIIGITPEKMKNIKRRISSEPNLKNMVRDNLDKAMNHMLQMDCLFHISYQNNDPYVIKTTELNQTHLNQLKQRALKIK